MALLVGTEEGLFELQPHGAATTHLAGRRIGAVDHDGTSCWAVVDGTQVWQAGSDLTGWQQRAEAAGDTRLNCLVAGSGDLLVGTSGARLLRLHDGAGLEELEGFEELESRAQWYTPWGGPPDTRSIARGVDGTVFVGVHVGGVVSSSDGGRSWRQSSLDIHADVHQVLVDPAHAELVVAPCAEGLAVSDDVGDHWRIDRLGLHATYARAAAVAGDTLVLSTSTGPAGERSALYRRPLPGPGAFERCRDGLPEWFEGNIDTGCLVAHHDTVVAASSDNAIWRSDDRGATWSQMTTMDAPVHALALSA